MTTTIPISRITFDGLPFSISPLSCDIDQAVGQHEQVRLMMRPVAGLSMHTGAYKTLSFAWDADESGRFFGYVTEYTVGAMANAPGAMITVTAMGPTSVMKTGRPRFFANSTTAQAIASITAEAQLGFLDEFGKEHYVWPQLAQTDESDWEFINDLAAKEGSQLLCTDGVLRLIDPKAVLTRTDPVLLLTNSQAQSNMKEAGLLDFSATSYSDRLPSRYNPTVAFLNGNSVETVSGSTGMYPFQQYFSGGQPLRNRTEAELAQTSLPVDWGQQAQARVPGSALLAPGVVVYVKSGSRAAVDEPYDGLWYVMETRHVLAKLTFQSTLSLARMVNASKGVSIPSKNWWLDPRGRPTLVLNNVGNWASTWR